LHNVIRFSAAGSAAVVFLHYIMASLLGNSSDSTECFYDFNLKWLDIAGLKMAG